MTPCSVFCASYCFPYTKMQRSGAVSSLGTSFVAVCLSSPMAFSAGMPGRHHWICWRWHCWSVCVLCPAHELWAALAVGGDARASWGAVQSEVALKTHSSLQRWLLIYCQVKASEMACCVPVSIVGLRKIGVGFCSSKAVGAPSCCNTHF